MSSSKSAYATVQPLTLGAAAAFPGATGTRMAMSHSLPKRMGPRIVGCGGTRLSSADFHSLAIPAAVADSVDRAANTLSSALIQKVLAAGGTDASDPKSSVFHTTLAAKS